MILRSGFDPRMPWIGYTVAKEYMGGLNKLGHLVMLVAGSKLVYFVVTPIIAITVSSIVLAFAFYLGREYSRYDKELVQSTKLWGLLRLMSHAWQFWVAMLFFMSLGIGMVQWTEIESWKAII
jgi:hypothetical protein